MLSIIDQKPKLAKCPPSSNTGGKVGIDYLSVVGPADFRDFRLWPEILEVAFGFPVELVDRERGLHGYSRSYQIVVEVYGGDRVQVGIVAFGGDAQRGTLYLSLTGVGCQLVSNWDHLRATLSLGGFKITRVDLCADFLDGEYTVDECAADYMAGAFNAGGRRPSASQQGNWMEPDGRGRTLYVGRRENGKMLRCYEKGKQLGNSSSPWVRAEVEIRNRDRVIPWEVLSRPVEFFAGAYPRLALLVNAAAERIRAVTAGLRATADRLIAACRNSYGQLFDVMLSGMGFRPAKVFQMLSRPGAPRDLRLSLLSDSRLLALSQI